TAAYLMRGKYVAGAPTEPACVSSSVDAISSKPWSRMRFGPSPPRTSRPRRSMRRHSSQPLRLAPIFAGGGRRLRTSTGGPGFDRATASSSSSVGVTRPEHPQSDSDIRSPSQAAHDPDHALEHGVALDDR